MKRAVLCILLVASALMSGEIQGQSALVALSFSTGVIEVGRPTTIDLLIDCQVESCAAADISVQFVPGALRIDAITLGEFATRTGNGVHLLEAQIDSESATFTLRYVTRNDGYPGSVGTGTLAHITVTALTAGASELQFTRASIVPLDGEPIFTAQTTATSIIAQPIRALQTVSVQAEASPPNQVTVSGSVAAVVSETISGETLLLMVDPAIDARSALKIDAPGHLGCTTAAGQAPAIRLRAGDVNDDGRIDLQDAALIGVAANPGQAAEADINHDGVIDIFDLIHVGRNYGSSSGEC